MFSPNVLKVYQMKKSLFLRCVLFSVLCSVPSLILAQIRQIEAFRPFEMPPGNTYRTGEGSPGPEYWQNRADYVIKVQLDDKNHVLRGHVEITYTNHSPHALSYLWIQLDQNLFKQDSRGALTTPIGGARFGNQAFNGGYAINTVEVLHQGSTYSVRPVINDTHMKVELRDALDAKGAKITVRIPFSFSIPEYGSDRMGRLNTKNGWIYTMAQWFPRMAVYDDVNGWDVQPYLGAGEFYLNYGDIEYHITAPWDHLVVGSGDLLNPEEVLTAEQRRRLDKASGSKQTVMIRSAKEITDPNSRPVQRGTLTWKFKIENTRDAAFASSKAFIWDAAGSRLKSGRTVMSMSVYPIESDGYKAWGRSTEYTRYAIEFYSDKWYEYPYPTAINVAGTVGGMEYPGVSFCSWQATEGDLWGVTNHEFGHNWFPMIVGSNERKHAWMDEGFNTFINAYATETFNKGEYQPRRNDAREFVAFLNGAVSEPMYTYADHAQSFNLGNLFYYKPALGLKILREQVLGEARFDRAFQTYIERWAFKHPTPWDFFRTIENVSGENLGWFWRGWFMENWNLDQAVKEVVYKEGDPKKGSIITLSNLDKMVMPVTLAITEQNGTRKVVKLPVEIWMKGVDWSFEYASSSPITAIVLDPEGQLPDKNPDNNRWVSAGSGQ